MAPAVEPTAVNFYTKKDFEGEEYPYAIDADVSVTGELNDKFLSVNVGSAAKVIAWQHYNQTGIYKEWEDDHPDISDIDGLSRFRVVSSDTRAISFIFKDSTDGDPKQYSLKVDARDVGSVLILSDDGEGYRLVGILPSGGPPITTGIYVRDEKSKVYIATGSIYFQWNASTKQVDIVEDANFPKQLEHKRTGDSAFEITLVDNKPTE
ncbi:membrane binding-domain-containing protein [Podospora australis]|uniref:Membrane binding-domain-containing protein n=1 Tax=Podospora australis TaxID=1536484 RepID=A0AAN6WT45_9PEZI|nr:membrane binding-domain-containing protein [Podospora australis]